MGEVPMGEVIGCRLVAGAIGSLLGCALAHGDSPTHAPRLLPVGNATGSHCRSPFASRSVDIQQSTRIHALTHALTHAQTMASPDRWKNRRTTSADGSRPGAPSKFLHGWAHGQRLAGTERGCRDMVSTQPRGERAGERGTHMYS